MNIDSKKLIVKTTRDLLEKHGYTNWSVGFNDRMLRTAGRCNYTSRKIEFSRKCFDNFDYETGMNTALHEVAHVIAGTANGHNHVWKKVHMSLGGNGRARVEHEKIAGALPVTGTCPNGHTTKRSRIPRKKYSCKQCAPYFNESYIFSWTRTV